MKICEKCGAQLQEAERFCSVCGAPQAQTAQPQFAQQPQYKQQPQQPPYAPAQYPQTPSVPPAPKKKSKAGPAVIAVLSVLLVAAAGVVAWMYFSGRLPAAPDTASSSQEKDGKSGTGKRRGGDAQDNPENGVPYDPDGVDPYDPAGTDPYDPDGADPNDPDGADPNDPNDPNAGTEPVYPPEETPVTDGYEIEDPPMPRGPEDPHDLAPNDRYSFIYRGVLYTPENIPGTMVPSNGWRELSVDDVSGEPLGSFSQYLAPGEVGEVIKVNGDLHVRLRFYNPDACENAYPMCNLTKIEICNTAWDQEITPPLPDGFSFCGGVTGSTDSAVIRDLFGEPDGQQFGTVVTGVTYYFGDASGVEFTFYRGKLAYITVTLPAD